MNLSKKITFSGKLQAPVCLAMMTISLITIVACGKDNQVPVADLPSAVQEYVQAHYPGYSLDEAEKETLCSGAEAYAVEIEQGEDQELELFFNLEGGFLYEEKSISKEALPTSVINSFNNQYGGFTLVESDQLTLANGAVHYELDIEKGNVRKEAIFDAEAQVICERDDD